MCGGQRRACLIWLLPPEVLSGCVTCMYATEFTASSAAGAVVEHWGSEYLARISYSLYLAHGIGLFPTGYLLNVHFRERYVMVVVLILVCAMPTCST